MATLILTTVGTAVGGPVGGAIGALIGNQVDQRLFAPRRQGARLGALTVQTSAYGQPIPKLFGRLRVAGTVIWATDLREDRNKSGGGKGKPATTSYSYSASFAVALSGRPIRTVHRIWADGKLVRGAAGDWKSETGFRLHTGDEGQAVDPLLAAAEGTGGTPAYRGIAYVVFEDMQLADFGNRIPSLTFEVEADDAAVSIGTIAAVLSDGTAGGQSGATLAGYAASGDSVRGAIEALGHAIPLSVRDDGTRLLLSDAMPAPVIVASGEMGSGGEGRRAARRSIDRQAVGTLPDEVAVTYYEPARDYQAGLQRARRGGPGRRVEAIELAAALEAGAAKAIAERRLADGWAQRTTAAVTLPWRRLDLRPGDALEFGAGDRWRITGWTLEGMILALRLRAMPSTTASSSPAQPGRVTPQDDRLHGPTRIVLLDLPPLDEATSAPSLWLAAAGPSPGWRRATVTVSNDGDASWTDAGSTALPAVMGAGLTALATGDAALIDMVNTVEVALLNDAMVLLSRTDDALMDGANLAMLGDELLQFGLAEPLGGGRWRLSRLLRGRRGSEAAMSTHSAGEPFVLVERDSLLALSVSTDRIGADLHVLVSGVADPAGVEAVASVSGRAVRPPAPVHLRAAPVGDGLQFGWTRRSRAGWNWTDGGEVALGEEVERYRLAITPATGSPHIVEVDAPVFLYAAAMQQEDGARGAAWFELTVVQLGVAGASPPSATVRFTPKGDRL